MNNILLLQTGGTIAMDISDQQAKLNPDRWIEVLYQEIPELSQLANITIEQLFFEGSSDIHRKHWIQLAEFIYQHHEEYDGFVILHGTDTMAYTASALSFALQNLHKPVILTGSQVPMSSIRSDARRNLVNSIEVAMLPLYEVAICFNDFVYRGNRSTKMSIGDFDAFASPNFPPLAEIGIDIELQYTGRKPAGELKLSSTFSDEIFLLKLHPNLNKGLLEQLDLSNVRAVVIEAFGSGNFPIHGSQSLLPFFKKCLKEDILLVFTSQAPYDAVNLSNYESGRKALELGALSAKDMTTEATLTKIMYLLGLYSESQDIKSAFNSNLAGEMSL